MNSFVKITLVILLFIVSTIAKENAIVESQPQIIFKHKNLVKIEEKTTLISKFNTAVLYLSQKKYKEAIELFQQSSNLLKIASYLNIAIAYYKLGDKKEAYKYLSKIYEFKELIYNDKFSYFSAAFYLYKITNERKYIDDIISVARKSKKLSYEEKNLVIDTYILLGKYKNALKWLEKMPEDNSLKKALLYLKLKNYTQAKIYLDQAYERSAGDKEKNDALWFKIYRDLKANDLVNLKEDLISLRIRKNFFHSNKKLPFELFFNKYRLTPKQYFKEITDPSVDTKIDFTYYFAPFIFEDYNIIDINAKKGFILRDKNQLKNLNTTIKYNADFLKVIKLDPIRRVEVLQKMIDVKYDTNSYEYYNLALSYAQVYDFINAFKYFKKAYSLDKGNKLYAVMLLLTSQRAQIELSKRDKDFLVKNILSKDGSYVYFSQYIYKIFIDPSVKLDSKYLTNKAKKSIFFRSLYFLENFSKNGIRSNEPLLVEYSKDPLVYLLTLLAKNEGESQYQYIARIQDNIPRIYNNIFIKNSLVITDFYIKALRALGLYDKTDFSIPNNIDPSYLRTQAIVQLYRDNGKETLKIVDYIQRKYDFYNIDLQYLLVAAYLQTHQKDLALAVLSQLEFIYNDKDSKFFSGIKLIQDLKVDSAIDYFEYKLKGKLIDFRLRNFDNYLEDL